MYSYTQSKVVYIISKVFAPKHVHKLTLYDCRTCIWYMPEWLCSFQQFVFMCDKCINLGQVKKQKIRNLIYLRPKVTLHCLFIYFFRIFVSDV